MKIAVLGGGVTGMCAALRLQEAAPDLISEIVIIEKELHHGGLLQTTRQNGCWGDNGACFCYWDTYLPQPGSALTHFRRDTEP